MRSVSGVRNRLILLVAAMVTCAVAVYVGVLAWGLADQWPQVAPLLPRDDADLTTIAADQQRWLLPVGLVVSALALLAGLALLLAQVPSRPATVTLRLMDDDGAELGSLEPAVLERALTEQLEALAGVVDASVHLSGAATAPWVQASVTVADDAEVDRTVAESRRMLARDTSDVLGSPVTQVDLLVRLRTPGARSSALRGSATGTRDATPVRA